jgi:hypothetical protein
VTSLYLAALLAGASSASSIFPQSPFSQGAAGTTSAAFLKLPSGARQQALAGTSAAGSEGADAVFWNPAGLARMAPEDRPEAALSYGMLLAETFAGSGAFARPTSKGAWAAGFTYFGQSAQTAYTAQGDTAGEFTPYDVAFSGSYGHRFEKFSLGGTLKVVRTVINDVSGATAALDFGVQARHVTMIGDGPADVGAYISNLGPALAAGTAAPLPFAARVGVLWHASPIFHPAFDLNFPVDEDPYVSFGVEARFSLGGDAGVSERFDTRSKRSAALRAGFNQAQAREVDGFVGMTAGGGVDLGFMRLDYAWAPYGDLGMTNRITVGFRF